MAKNRQKTKKSGQKIEKEKKLPKNYIFKLKFGKKWAKNQNRKIISMGKQLRKKND